MNNRCLEKHDVLEESPRKTLNWCIINVLVKVILHVLAYNTHEWIIRLMSDILHILPLNQPKAILFVRK
jgi:hypothetical protein